MERRLVEWGILVDGSVADPFTSLQAEFNSTLFLDYTLFSIVISSCYVTIALLGQEGLNPFPFFCTRNTLFHRHDT